MPRRNKTTFMLKLAFALLVILAASAFPLGSVAAVSPADSLTTETKTHRPGILVGCGSTGPVVRDSTWLGHYWSEPGFTVVHSRRARKEDVPPNVARVRVDVKPANAEVIIDGFPVEASREQKRAVWLEPGSHLVEIRHPGYRTLSLNMQVAGGGSYEIYRRLQRQEGVDWQS